MYSLLLLVFMSLCVVLISVILMQQGRGQGLAGVFGGGEMQTMLGPRAADFLEKVTWGGVTLFFVLTIVLSLFVSQRKGSLVDQVQLDPQPVPRQTAPIPQDKPISEMGETEIPTVPTAANPAPEQTTQPETVPATTEPAGETTAPAGETEPTE